MSSFSHESAEVYFVISFTDWTKHSSAGPLIRRQQTLYYRFLHKQNCVDINALSLETFSVPYNLGQIQTCKWYFCFYFSVAMDSGKILASVWQDEENFEVLRRCYIQIYPTIFLLCYGKNVHLQHMWNLKCSNVEIL